MLFILSINGIAQVAHDPNVWNAVIGMNSMDIYNPEDFELVATVTIELNGQEYTKDVKVEGSDWQEVTYESLGLTYLNMPESSGAVEALITVEAGGEGVIGDFYFISLRNRNQGYDVGIEEIEERINLYGSIIDDCIFWVDYNGYNYAIRSHHEGNGIFLSHWTMNVFGETERIGYYKGKLNCENNQVLFQRHSIGWALEDADENGYMEFYTFVVDGCVPDWQHPTEALLMVFTNKAGLNLKGTTYSLTESTDDLGGSYTPSEKLKENPEIQKQAEAAWEVYVME